MNPGFEVTRRALLTRRTRSHAALLVPLTLLSVLWGGWMTYGRIPLYVASSSARFEAKRGVVQLNAPVSEMVERCELRLGRRVEVGDLLLKLESTVYELQLAEKRAMLAARERTADALHAQLAIEREARVVLAELVTRTARAGRARSDASRRSSELKAEERAVIERLSRAEVASKLDAMKVASESEGSRLQTEVLGEQGELDTATARANVRDRDVRIAALQKQTIDAESELAIERAKLESLSFEVERRSVRAPTAGVLADVIACAPGMMVTSTQGLGTILPDDPVRLVARFDPRSASGRVHPGQRAVVRVDNFPWTQYGTVDARVVEAGTEPRDGAVRVELEIARANPAIATIHGLVATVEVETERVAPGALLLRLAGQPWSADRPDAPAPSSSPSGHIGMR